MKQQTFKNYGILSLCFTTLLSVNAQTKWRYTYDNAGNRIKRVITTGSAARAVSEVQPNLLLAEDGISAILEQRNSRLRIEAIGKGGMNVFVYDLSGRELVCERSDGDTFTVNISHLRRGIYIMTIETGEEKKSCKFNK
jgi:YD repeat-containing protein